MGCACTISEKAVKSEDVDLTHKIIESISVITLENANNSTNKLPDHLTKKIKKSRYKKTNNIHEKKKKISSLNPEKTKNENDIILSGPIITFLKQEFDKNNNKKDIKKRIV